MAVGVSVVASREGGIRWMVEAGVTGRLVEDPHDPQHIAERMHLLLGQDDLRSMSQNAPCAAQRHRASAVAAQTIAACREILARGGTARQRTRAPRVA
jgi:hypothetical protein